MTILCRNGKQISIFNRILFQKIFLKNKCYNNTNTNKFLLLARDLGNRKLKVICIVIKFPFTFCKENIYLILPEILTSSGGYETQRKCSFSHSFYERLFFQWFKNYFETQILVILYFVF